MRRGDRDRAGRATRERSAPPAPAGPPAYRSPGLRPRSTCRGGGGPCVPAVSRPTGLCARPWPGPSVSTPALPRKTPERPRESWARGIGRAELSRGRPSAPCPGRGDSGGSGDPAGGAPRIGRRAPGTWACRRVRLSRGPAAGEEPALKGVREARGAGALGLWAVRLLSSWFPELVSLPAHTSDSVLWIDWKAPESPPPVDLQPSGSFCLFPPRLPVQPRPSSHAAAPGDLVTPRDRPDLHLNGGHWKALFPAPGLHF